MATYELYRITAGQKVTLSIPDDAYISSVTIKSPGYPEGSPYSDLDTNEVTIPFKHTLYNGNVEVKVLFTIENEAVEITQSFPVVTPLFTAADLTPADLKSIGNPTEDDVRQLESFVRHIIEAYTGQSFGYFRRTVSSNRPSSKLTFNVPLLEFIGVSERYATHSQTLVSGIPYEIVDDGFGVNIDWNRYHIKTDSFLPVGKRGSLCGVSVQGKFGYLSVPQDVKQAALTLLSLFQCEQSLWRDRYVENLRNADGSSLKYNEGAYFGTGSVTADQLLEKYVRTGFSVDVV